MNANNATKKEEGTSNHAKVSTSRSGALRERVVYYASVGASVAPFFSTILPHLLLSKQPLSVLLGSLTCMLGSVLNYFIFVRPGKVLAAAAIQTAIIILTYSASVAFSGGVHSHLIVYAPFMPIFAGFLSGIRGAWASAFFLVVLYFALAQFQALLPLPPEDLHAYEFTLAIQVSFALLAVAGLTSIYEMVTESSESELRDTILQLEKSKEKAAESNSFLNTILSNIPLVVFVKDYKDQGRYSLINEEAKNFMGPLANSVVGKKMSDIFPAEHAAASLRTDMEVFKGRAAQFIDCEEVPLVDGDKPHRSWLVPTYDANGNPHLMITISQDISEELAVKKALEVERAQRQQNAKLASLGEMAAGVAHEINNPLALVLGNARMLTKFASNPEKHQAYVTAINEAGERIQKIVSGLKKFSRSNEEKDYRPHVLAGIVKDVLVLTEASSIRNNVSVTAELTSEAQILCDEVEIEQVLVNLIHNAIDAVKDLNEKWVRVTMVEESEALLLRVIDSGRGIPEKTAAKLFDPFFTTKPVGEGTGLGLSIAKGILDQHQAAIALLVEEAHTTFEIRFKKLVSPDNSYAK